MSNSLSRQLTWLFHYLLTIDLQLTWLGPSTANLCPLQAFPDPYTRFAAWIDCHLCRFQALLDLQQVLFSQPPKHGVLFQA